MTQSVRSYELVLSPDGDQVGAHVLRHGPADPLQVGLGRPASDAPRLASAIFPLCPMAHRSAVELALEHAAGVQRRDPTREARVLAEAVSAAVFRAGVTWASLIEKDALVDAVRLARETAASIETLGVAMAADRLARALEGTTDYWLDLMEGADSVAFSDEEARIAFLSRLGNQHSQAQALVETLRQIELEQAPVPATPSDGEGQGTVETARGGLTHSITIREGRIARWQAEAPTDRNFAPAGPLERAAVRLALTEDLDLDAQILIASFDPCVPCTVRIEERADA